MSDDNRLVPSEQEGTTGTKYNEMTSRFWDMDALAQKMERASELLGEISEHAGRISPAYKQVFDDARAAIADFGMLLDAPDVNGRVTQIVAPMPGIIMRVHKKPGEDVNKGDVLLLLDAMKVENPIRIPVAGKLLSIRYGEGQRVAKGSVLAVINHSVSS